MGNNQPSARKKTYYISLAILAGMFFIFGFVSWVNSILIPYFRISCELTHFESYFVAFAFYIAYFVMAIPSGILLKKVGFKKGIMYGFMLTVWEPLSLSRQLWHGNLKYSSSACFLLAPAWLFCRQPPILMSPLSAR